MEIVVPSPDEERLRAHLASRKDAEARRIERFLAMPDLSRQVGHPLAVIVGKALSAKSVRGFDIIRIPEIVPVSVTFDLFNMPPGHPARSPSDTYYVDGKNILRTHDTVMWYYYFNLPEIKERLKKREPMGVVCYGKVYRKDEIDRKHMNVFHQFGGLYLTPNEREIITLDNLKDALTDIAQSIFGRDIKNRFNSDVFPYTDPSLEMEIEKEGQWIEMLGCGLPRQSVLANFGVAGYNGWAFGFGLERLAIVSMKLPDIRLLWSTDERVKRQLKLGQTYREVSKYPPVTRDISFVVPDTFVPNNYFDVIRDIGGDVVEEVTLLDTYTNEAKFGKGKVSYTYRIIYRSIERTLTTAEIEPLQQKIEEETKRQSGAEIR